MIKIQVAGFVVPHNMGLSCCNQYQGSFSIEKMTVLSMELRFFKKGKTIILRITYNQG